MVWIFRHRQTKETETDKLNLTPPRHIPTLPKDRIADGQASPAVRYLHCIYCAPRNAIRNQSQNELRRSDRAI
jgi:hypothetical protein